MWERIDLKLVSWYYDFFLNNALKQYTEPGRSSPVSKPTWKIRLVSTFEVFCMKSTFRRVVYTIVALPILLSENTSSKQMHASIVASQWCCASSSSWRVAVRPYLDIKRLPKVAWYWWAQGNVLGWEYLRKKKTFLKDWPELGGINSLVSKLFCSEHLDKDKQYSSSLSVLTATLNPSLKMIL